MNKYSVFNELTDAEISSISESFGFEDKSFGKGEVIMKFRPHNKNSGIIKEGLAYLISINDRGEENILDYYEGGNIFGSAFSPDTNVNLYFVVAKKKCTVSFFDHSSMIKLCRSDCKKHIIFIENIMTTISCRNQIHIDILSQRTIRSRLTTYFAYLSEISGTKTLRLPIPLCDLAEYICTDRSAMMRELGKMNEDGLISSSGHTIQLL